MIPVQYDFFETKEESILKAQEKAIEDVKLSCDKVRKKLFACNGELYKIIYDLQERLQILERNICKPESHDLPSNVCILERIPM